MKKEKVKTLLIIILLVFAVIPFVWIALSNVFKLEEGLTVNLKTSGEMGDIDLGLKTGSDDVEHTQIDRVVDDDGKYKYCIGDVTCSAGALTKIDTDAYELDGTKVGYTYNEMCDDGTTQVGCIGTSSISQFYGPFDGLPASFQANGNNMIISDDMTPPPDDMTPPPDDGGDDDQSDKNNTMKCLADNGAITGDPLCCGQEGVVQNTKYNCPTEYPHCIGYKCGETWGRCSTTSDK